MTRRESDPDDRFETVSVLREGSKNNEFDK